MNFEQGLPLNINNLPKYFVSNTIFICTAIAIIIFVVISIIFVVTWIYRVCMKMYHLDYFVDFVILFQQQQQTRRKIQVDINSEDDSGQSGIRMSRIPQYQKWSQIQSRSLQFVCLSVVIVLNISTNTCGILCLVTFFVAILLFIIFNLIRAAEDYGVLRNLWLLPFLISYISFYITDSNLIEK